ncbi:MAG: hypothetical protein HY729_03115 [Candidatus Rokubacteria bacterium]|nr:hypothetical protein [Candidatus Rokubacteria bacterium]
MLCLLWRLGLASQWVLAPTKVTDEALLGTSERLLAAHRNDPSVPTAFADLDALERRGLAGAHAPMVPRGAFLRVLARSPLGRLANAHADHPAAVVATAVLVLREGAQDERRRRRQLPVFWRRFLAPCFTAAPRFWVPTAKPVWDPATWQLIAILDAAWNADGVSFVGRERGQLFHVLGTRRMARTFGWPRRRALAACRTAYRVWRHWFQTQEARRLVQIDTWPLPEAVGRVIGGPRPLYRQAREARRAGMPAENLAVLPERLRQAFDAIAAESAASLQSPVAFGWTPPPLAPLASALVLSPLGLLAARAGVGREDLSGASKTTAAPLLRMLTGPWPWTPRPVIRGPRRAWIEARRRGAEAKPTWWTPRDGAGGGPIRPANLARQ